MILRVVTLALALVAAPAFGQGADFGGPAPSDEDLEAQEGLESATPTDNVNEIGGNGAAGNGADAPINDFPAGENSGNFNIEDTGQGTSDNALFDDGPVDLGNDKNAGKGTNNLNSSFGNGAPAKNNAAPANNVAPKNNVAPVNNIPAQTLNSNAAPANASPTNAQSLLNQISNNVPAPTNAAPSATATTEATGDEALTPKVEIPAIKAPPLPPPNDFSGAPPVPGTMRLMADGEAPEEYKVEPGDTLFDICDQMLDEAAYWPKLWALNPEIKNPHFIFPNMRLKFYPGDDETPPYLQVVSEDDVIPIDKGDLDEQELIAEKVIFPGDPEAQEGFLTEVIGPSQVDELQDSFLMSGRRFEGTEVAVQVPGFIFSEEKDPAAYVVAGRAGESNLAETHQAVVEASSGVSVGTLYTVLRKGGEVYSPETGDSVGYRYFFVANMRIDRAIEDGLYVGTVQNTRLGVYPDDLLVSFISTNRTVPIGSGIGALSNVSATIVGFEGPLQEIGAVGSFAFFDKGNGDGVQPGMYVPIFGTPGYLTSSFGSGDLPVDYEFLGVARIVDSTDAGSVGYIMKTVKEFRIGDRTNKS